jgi:hypothetical protein
VLIAPESRFVMIHVQKTGGLSVDEVLRKAAPDAEAVSVPGYGRHAGIGQLLAVRPECASYFVLGFVRNPWARLYSWWAMIQRRKASAEAGNAYVVEMMSRNRFWRQVVAEYADFETFVLRGTREIDRLGTPQLAYLSSPDKDADFVGRTETLEDDLRRVLDLLDLPTRVEVPHRNAAPASDYRRHYTPAMRDRVGEAFAPDLERFGYEF